MPDSNRRQFLQNTSAGLASSAALVSARQASAANAADEVVVALVGHGGRGHQVASLFASLENVRLGWVADANKHRLQAAAKGFDGQQPKLTDDMRKVFDDPSVDAVIIATPDHWHAPAAILACDAGKHVYVEKPCSHNIREGRLLVEAARRNKRLVQHGTQVRSTQMMIEAVQRLRDGIIGDVKVVKAWNIQRRGSIGHDKPQAPPAHLDYELWQGPAPPLPYQRNRVDTHWNWWYHYGVGDMGNDGVHDIDYARWGLGVETHPNRVVALGGKYFFDDDQQFPDTQQVTFEYDGDGSHGSQKMFIYEQRLWSTNYPYNTDSGVEYYGTKGQLFLSRRGKAQWLGDRNERKELDIPLQPQDDKRHVINFVEAVRGGTTLNAEIEIGHLTTSLCHLGNIAVRMGRPLQFDPVKEEFIGDDSANRLVGRTYRSGHWAIPQGA